MTNGFRCTTPICLHAPQDIANAILRPRMTLLHEQCPGIRLWINPTRPIGQTPKIQLGFEDLTTPGMICRRIGQITSRTYLHRRSKIARNLPDIIAARDPSYKLEHTERPPIVQDLYLSFSAAHLHVVGLRQTLDWVDCSLSSLFWLNVPQAA